MMFLSNNEPISARPNFQRAFEIATKLVTIDPTSIDSQNDLLINLGRLAVVGAPGYTWARAKQQLDVMIARNMIAPADAMFANFVRQKAAEEAARK
jgi:hypothetical protein